MKNRSLLLILLSVAHASLGYTQTRTWEAVGEADWNLPANWSGDAVPLSTDAAEIVNGGTAILGIGATGVADSLLVSSSLGGEVRIAGGTLTVGGTVLSGQDALGYGSISVTGDGSNRGVLAAGQLVAGSSLATLGVDGGVLRALRSESNFLSGYGEGKVVIGAGGAYVDTNTFAITMDSPLSGAGALVKQGAGTLTLSGDSDFAGGTVLEQGTLRVGSNSSLGTGALTLQGGTIGNVGIDDGVFLENDLTVSADFSIDAQGVDGFLEFFGNVDLGTSPTDLTRTITLTSEGLACFGGVISGDNLTLITNGNSAQAMFCSDTTNTFSGTLTVGDGVSLELWKVAGNRAISGDLVIDAGGKVILLVEQQFAATSDVEVNGILQDESSGTTTVNELTGSGSIISESDAVLVVNSGSFSGTIAEGEGASQALVKESGDVLILTGENTYTGGTTINGGILQIGDGGATGSIVGDIANNATLEVNRSGVFSYTGAISGTGQVVKSGTGTLNLSGDSSYSGGTKVTNGTLVVDHDHALGTGAVRVESGGLVVSSGISIANHVVLAGGTYARDITGSLVDAVNATSSFGGMDTTARILAGNTEAATTLSTEFSAGDGMTLGDIYTLQGTAANVFVLELSFTSTAPDSYLGWMNGGGQWVNARDGNVGENHFGTQFIGSFADFQAAHPLVPLDEALGAWGVDVNGGVTSVWAVLNHNGDFGAVPEPSTWALLGLGLLTVLFLRRRKGRLF